MVRLRVIAVLGMLGLGMFGLRPAFAADAPAIPGLDGSWNGEQVQADGAPVPATLIFSRNGSALTGRMRSGNEEMPLFDVRDTGGRVSFSLIIPGTPYINVHYFGARVGNELRLVSPDDGQGVFTLTAFRVIAGAPPASVPLAAPSPAATPAPAPAPVAPTPITTPAPVAAAPTPAAPPGTVAFSPTAPLPLPGQAAPAPQVFSQTASLPAPRPSVAPPPATAAATPPAMVASLAPAPPPTPPPPLVGSILGNWNAEQSDPNQELLSASLVFARSGGTLSGTLRTGTEEAPLFEVRETATGVSFTRVVPGTPYRVIHYAGTRQGDNLTLASPDEGDGIYRLSARRDGAAPSAQIASLAPPAAAAAPQIQAPLPPERENISPPLTTAAPAPPPLRQSLPETPPPVIATAPPAPPPVTAAPSPPMLATRPGGLDGNWAATQTAAGSASPIEASLVFAGGRGQMHVGADDWPVFDVKRADDQVFFTLVIPGTPYVTIQYGGTVTGDRFEVASLDASLGAFKLSARRASATTPVPVTPAPAPPPIAAAPPPPPIIAPPAPAPIVAPPAPPPPPPVAAAPPPPQPRVGSIAPPPATTPPQGSLPPLGSQPALGSLPPQGPLPPIAAPTQGVQVAPSTIAPPIPPPAPPSPPAPTIAAGPPVKLPLPPLRDVAANGLMRIPPMGWASRQRLGTDIDDAAIRQAADGLDETPLKAAGYTYVEVGEGWQGTRDASGAIRGNTKFPDMKALGDHIHTRGLQFGLTISAAPKSCNGFEGSYGHEAEDARTFASWGVDFLIYDWCGAESIYPTQAEQQAAYQKMAEALRASGRDIAFAIDQDGAFNVGTWAAKAGANLWRTGKDIADNWQSVAEAGFKPDTSDAPARWADPGLVQIGNGGMTDNEYRTHLNLWAVRGAPLMLGNDVRIMRPETVTLLTNREVIAIDQDAGGRQGKRVAQVGQTEVWAKPLADGSTAVAFFNRGDASAPVAVSWQQLGLAGPRQVRDLWWHENIGSADNRYVVFLTARTSLLLRFSR